MPIILCTFNANGVRNGLFRDAEQTFSIENTVPIWNDNMKVYENDVPVTKLLLQQMNITTGFSARGSSCHNHATDRK